MIAHELWSLQQQSTAAHCETFCRLIVYVAQRPGQSISLKIDAPQKCFVLAGAFDQCLAEVLSAGTATGLSVLGNCGINCAACYSCHSREKFRRYTSVLV